MEKKVYENAQMAFKDLWPYKSCGGDRTTNVLQKILYEDKEVIIYLFEQLKEVFPYWRELNNGLFLFRKDGTARQGIVRKYFSPRNISPPIKSVENIKKIDGKIVVDIVMVDGSVERAVEL